MIGIWFKEDIERILAEHRYVVVTDANGEGEFLLKYLSEDIKQLPISNEYSEIEAKYLAESKYVDSPVLFYVRKKAQSCALLCQKESATIDFPARIRTNRRIIGA